MAIIKNLFTL